MKRRKGLGSLGVDALLSTQALTVAPEHAAASRDLVYLDIERICPNRHQPRIHIDEEQLNDLAQSLHQQGMIQPVVVRSLPDRPKYYEMIAGERRWRAAQRIGLQKIPAIIRQADEQQVAMLTLVENIQRADLNVLEEAAALQNMIKQFSLTHEAVATMVGRSRTVVTNLLRLLDLHGRVQQLLNEGALEMAHARTLLRLDKDEQSAVAQVVVRQQMNVRQTERYVAQLLELKQKPHTRVTAKPAVEITALERKLTEHLGAPVRIEHQKSGGGKLTIRYNSLTVLDGILEKIH